MQRSLIVMVKEPHPGRVKTRLGREIGMVNAAWWFRHQVFALLRRIQDPRWRVYLAVSPDAEGTRSRVWPAHFTRIPQGRGDLGTRMKTVLQSVPKGPACVIGADIPDISRKLVWKAFEQLGSNQAVFGPAPDGGFWLAGFSHPQKMPAATFRNVRWSSRHALNDSIQSLGQVPGDDLSLQGKIGFIDSLDDVDTLEDLNRIKARSRASA